MYRLSTIIIISFLIISCSTKNNDNSEVNKTASNTQIAPPVKVTNNFWNLKLGNSSREDIISTISDKGLHYQDIPPYGILVDNQTFLFGGNPVVRLEIGIRDNKLWYYKFTYKNSKSQIDNLKQFLLDKYSSVPTQENVNDNNRLFIQKCDGETFFTMEQNKAYEEFLIICYVDYKLQEEFFIEGSSEL